MKAKQVVIDILMGFKSHEAIMTIGKVLNDTTDADLRYSLSYILSKFKNNDSALNALASIMVIEHNDQVFINASSSAILVANMKPDQIGKLLINYGKLPVENKKKFILSLTYYPSDSQYHAIYSA